jgi:hypothetical protein
VCNEQGQLHRLDGPAVEWWDGDKEWWLNGERHRGDGPSMIYSDTNTAWHFNGCEYTREEFVLLQFSKGIMTNECL